MITIELPFKTPTINHLYGQFGARKYLKPEAKKLRKEIETIVQKSLPIKYGDLDLDGLRVTVNIYENWRNKDGTIKKKDISNREKFLIDSIFETLGVDDKYIVCEIMNKVQSEDTEKSIILIEGIDKSEAIKYVG